MPEADTHVQFEGTRDEADGPLRRGSYDLAIVEAPDGQAAAQLLQVAAEHATERPAMVVLTSGDDAASRARLMAAGAAAVLDAELEDGLLADALAALIAQRRETPPVVASVAPGAPDLVDASQQLKSVLRTARRVARADSSVLILGETGVGKERIAQLIHDSSERRDGAFVPVNCAAIPSELFESELFGHERGAFTGAVRSRRGVFELAHEGTLFLDEVAEMPMHLQVKLLRALQDRRIRPVGAEAPIDVDVRVVAATNRDPATEMAAGRFRRDLYYRLGVVELVVPPLRDRPEDIDALADAYLAHFAAQFGGVVEGYAPEAREALRRYTWPGNVRELINVVERAVLLSEDERVGLGDLPAAVTAASALEDPPLSAPGEAGGSVSTGSLDDVIALPKSWRTETWKVVREGVLLAGERAYLSAVLRQTHGRIADAAKRAGMSPRALFDKMRRHGLRKEDFRDDG